jgi:outer membrane protein
MKKIILTVAAVFALTFANAQDKKEGSEGLAAGDAVLTGTFNFTNAKQGDAKANGLTVAPGLGYMIDSNWAIIAQVAYTSTEVDDVKDSGFAIGAGARYFWTPASKFSLSLGGQLSYGTTKNDATDVKVNTIGVEVPVGLHYFVSNNFAITTSWAGLSYTTSKADTDGAEALNVLNLKLDMSSINFGLLYKL